MELSRITSAIDVSRVRNSTVAIVGLGGARDLACSLCRSGVGHFKLFDPQLVEPVNVARQGHTSCDLAQTKVEATAAELRRINPDVIVETYAVDFTELADDELDALLAGTDLLILATDQFAAQAKGNQVALRLSIAAVFIGLYAQGLAGEIVFWHSGIDACYRCLCRKRYEMRGRAAAGENHDPSSDGATIFDVHLIDAVAGQVAIGLLTRGSDIRYGRLIGTLGDRNFIQTKIDPDFMLNGQDVVRTILGVAADNDSFVAWNTIARRDPDGGHLYCPDCDAAGRWCFQAGPRQGELRWLPPGTIHARDEACGGSSWI
jgi:hypothetical protein